MTEQTKKIRKIEKARLNTPAKKMIRRAEAWLAAEKNREIIIQWQWNQVKRFDRSGVFVAMDNGQEVSRKVFQNGNMHMPNLDFRKTNSTGHRFNALTCLVEELEKLEKV
jgi:hypothetical protein